VTTTATRTRAAKRNKKKVPVSRMKVPEAAALLFEALEAKGVASDLECQKGMYIRFMSLVIGFSKKDVETVKARKLVSQSGGGNLSVDGAETERTTCRCETCATTSQLRGVHLGNSRDGPHDHVGRLGKPRSFTV